VIRLSPHELLLFETFPEASQFARQISKQRDRVICLWPNARGWVVENPRAERKTGELDADQWDDGGSFYADALEYEVKERTADDSRFPRDEAYSIDGSLDEDWVLDHGT
jgi:hypothetical protein